MINCLSTCLIMLDNIDDDVETLLTVRVIHESNENYAKDALRVYKEYEPVVKRNEAALCIIYLVSFIQSRLMTMFQITVNTHCQQFKLLRVKKKQT